MERIVVSWAPRGTTTPAASTGNKVTNLRNIAKDPSGGVIVFAGFSRYFLGLNEREITTTLCRMALRREMHNSRQGQLAEGLGSMRSRNA